MLYLKRIGIIVVILLVLNCNVKIIPHNIHKSPKDKERGWVDTPSGIRVHKDALTKKEYKRYKSKH